MKDFRNLPPRPPQPLPAKPTEDRQLFIARNLANSLDRSAEVKQAVVEWLLSFQGAMSRKEFERQLPKLNYDDAKALLQLSNSKGKRTLQQLPREKPPKLEGTIISELVRYKLVAIEGAKGKKAIESFLADLPPGGVYILDVNELILEYVDYQHRGKAGDIIAAANRADILVIEGLEKPISLAYHIKDTLYQLAAVRKKAEDKYTVSTYNCTHTWYIPEYAELFQHFSV